MADSSLSIQLLPGRVITVITKRYVAIRLLPDFMAAFAAFSLRQLLEKFNNIVHLKKASLG